MIDDCWLVVPSTFLRSCIASKKKIICIEQNTQAYFESEVTICAQTCFEHCWDWAAN